MDDKFLTRLSSILSGVLDVKQHVAGIAFIKLVALERFVEKMNISPQHAGKYELQARLGRGGMGDVWKAQAVASLRHPNIVQVYDSHLPLPTERTNDHAYIVMDYVPGQTLADYIRSTSRAGKVPPGADIVRLFTSISLAIDYAHQQGLIHRDLKPANILLDARNTARSPIGEPVLTDFGLAKSVGDPTGTLTRRSVGTPLYLSPEQAQGHSGNEQSDIYSLGVILYEVLTGVTPFRGDSPLEIMMQQVNTLPIPPALINPHLPPAVNEVILRCLAKDPGRRFSSASALTAALAEAFHLPIPANLNLPAFPAEIGQRPTSYTTIPASSVEPISAEAPASPGWRARTGAFSKAPTQAPLNGASPVQSPLPPGPMPPAQPLPGKKPRSRLWMSMLLLLILLLVSAGLGVLFVFHPWSPGVPSTQVVGHAYFVNSGQLDLTQPNSPGLNDEVQIDLQNIPAPAAGTAYYAWLVKDNEAGTLLLGKLVVNAGRVHFVYAGDPQHTNLLAITNSLLITEEDANVTPSHPSFDRQLYHALLSQQPDPADPHHFSVLDHLRHLLSGEQLLDALGIYGGLNIWLLRNTARVDGWAGIARDYWVRTNTNVAFVRGQIVHILDVLEGKQTDPRDAPVARIALIDMPNAEPPDYMHHTINHLDALTRTPGATQEQRSLASHIETRLIQIMKWLEQVHQDARQLAAMTDQQLMQPLALSLLNNMEAAANDAYLGQIDPATGVLQQEGVVQIASEIQHLASFDVMMM